MLKDNLSYQKNEDASVDVNLLSKDQELNFSNKIEDDDETDLKDQI